MHEYKERKLKTSHGKIVTNPKQAQAIAINEALSVGQVGVMQFNNVVLADHWIHILGEICMPTYIMVFGSAGSGKSSLILQLADYLAGMDYTFLYIAGEQFYSPTFQKLLRDNNVRDNANLMITGQLPSDLSGYDYVVMDSKDSLKVTIDDFVQLKKRYPHQSFIVITHGIKSGDFKGQESWRNEVDTIIKCTDGIATTENQKNRWGGHGELVIFKN